jgi:hypothetical protein
MESSILSEVRDTSILRTGLSTDYAVISTSLASQIVAGRSACAPRSGLERSDFVPLAVSAVHRARLERVLRVELSHRKFGPRMTDFAETGHLGQHFSPGATT